jgi:hypothetical protein
MRALSWDNHDWIPKYARASGTCWPILYRTKSALKIKSLPFVCNQCSDLHDSILLHNLMLTLTLHIFVDNNVQQASFMSSA